jgi:3-hydroxybutyrate dehydrogenase
MAGTGSGVTLVSDVREGANPYQPEDLRGKVAIVTGAAGSLGRAICDRFTGLGATTVGTDLRGEGVFAADISTVEGNQEVVDHAIDHHGRIDILVLNAGVQHMAPIADFPVGEWHRLLSVMLTGPFLAMRASWPHLIAQPGGRILVTASTSSYVAEPFKAAYVAAKHGVLGLVKVAALEGASYGLTANAVAPSWMRTQLVEDQVESRMKLLKLDRDEVIAQLVQEHAVKRFVEVDEVAATFAFLAGNSAAAITGSCIPVDLGALA